MSIFQIELPVPLDLIVSLITLRFGSTRPQIILNASYIDTQQLSLYTVLQPLRTLHLYTSYHALSLLSVLSDPEVLLPKLNIGRAVARGDTSLSTTYMQR